MTSDPRADFIDASLWHGSLERAEAILAEHPEIASSDIHTAAILGDDATVRRFLEIDSANATVKGGPRGWDALTHLCFSKYLRLDRARSEGFVRAATALLDNGASPNTGFDNPEHQPKPTLESVLYGAAGVAHHPELTRLLLERGADPNDDEVPYHTPETLDNRAMKVLVGSGKLTPQSIVTLLNRKLDWHDEDGVVWLLSHGADPNLLTNWGGRSLHHALGHCNATRFFELLLDHGADPTLPASDGASAFAVAARVGRGDVLELFERRGFSVKLGGDDAFLAACARGDEAEARRIAASDQGLVQRLQWRDSGILVNFAGAGNTAAVGLMLDVGFDIASRTVNPPWAAGQTALHIAAWRGHLETARLLIKRGAPLDVTNGWGETPLSMIFHALEQQSEWTPNEYSVEIGAALLNAGARVDPGKLTLAAALCLGLQDEVERLARQATPKDRQIALAAAAFNGKIEAIATLIKLGVDVNAVNAGSNPYATALHNAVCSGSLNAVKMLVDAGARVGAKDTVYQATPLDWAEYYVRETKRDGSPTQYVEIAAYLRDKAGV